MTRQDKTALSGKGRGILQKRKWQAKMRSIQDGAAESLRLCSELGKLIYGLWFKPWPFEFCGQLDIEYLCYCPRPKLGKLVFSLWGLSSKSSLYHTSLARAYNHDTIWVKELSSWNWWFGWILWDYWFWILWECVNVESHLMPVWSMERSGTYMNMKQSVFFSNMRTMTSIQWIAWTISSSDSRCEMQSAASSQIKLDEPGGRVYVDHHSRSRRPICFEEPISGPLNALLVITCSTQDV